MPTLRRNTPSPGRKFPPIMVLLLVTVLTLGGCARTYSLTILHTNDIHAHLSQFDKYGQLCPETTDKPCSGGMARIADAARAERAQEQNVLLLDAGDQFQGTLYFTRFKGQAAATLMNAVGYDAMALGNHEFDAGPQVLADFSTSLNFPLLACNVDASTDTPLSDRIKPHLLLERGGRRIGIIGVITPETAFLSSPGATLQFNDPAPCLRQSIHDLSAQGAEIIIALSHNGYAADLELARTTPGLDIVVGGHSHTRLGSEPNSAGPYPTVVNGPSEQPVLVVQDGQWGRNLGRLTVDFDDSGVPVSWSGQPLNLDNSQPRAEDIVALVRGYQTELASFRSSTVGRLQSRIDTPKKQCRFGECILGNLVADATLDVSLQAGARAALINSGGLRAGLPAGEVTLGNVLTALPFANEILVAELPGQILLEVLEHGVSRADGTHDSGTGRFLQTAGLRYSWSPSRPEGQRILEAEIFDGHFWLPLNPNDSYRIALPDYLLGGGDGYTMLKPFGPSAYTTSLSTADALREYFELHSPLTTPGTGNRIRQMP
ncbi:bifunctional metallophosphatase/5'-nucleotidase [Desulfovibrio ferrophilus]|uniref:5'-Nucleotidase domain protein n=1 Tax=Desulfovibrio ferrophilus TaxID=241368 RepID=A0A2Z6B1B0_9BACT|nr:bifunctional metallophosphatase/5'-nucleotidase [Desulfovibrio ferrophilus]BBD09186.1 5'-Nucleotidase domain protein [Desulfovibrio ferrophilus]